MTTKCWTSASANDVGQLAEPLHFNPSGRTAPNRFLKSAMTERLASWDPWNIEERGVPSEALFNLYRTWARGSIGTILTGNIMIALDQLEEPGNAVIPYGAPFDGPRFAAFSQMASEGKRHGSLMVGQVSHPGNACTKDIAQKVISPSHIWKKFGPPSAEIADAASAATGLQPATQDDIDEAIRGFAHAAEYLERAGFDGVQLHGAHIYLLSQFLSPDTNHRADAYGGSVANRARIVLETVQAVRRRTSAAFILGIKLNSADFQSPGWRTEDVRRLFALLDAAGLDFVELAGGVFEEEEEQRVDCGVPTTRRDSAVQGQGFSQDFAALAAQAFQRARVYATGGFRTGAGMAGALGAVDGVGLGRPLCHEPFLCRDILAGRAPAAACSLIEDDGFVLSLAAAGAQVRRMGEGGTPVDFRSEESKARFLEDARVWAEEGVADTERVRYGWVQMSEPVET